MSTPKNPTEPAKRAISQATRAIAGEREVELQFTTDTPLEAGKLKRVPIISRNVKPEEIKRARGAADAFAFYHRYHSDQVARQFQSDDMRANAIFESLERMRTQIQGGRELPGALSNIDFEREDFYEKQGEATKENTSLADAMALWLRQNASNKPLGEGAQARLDLWDGQIENTAGEALDGLLDKIDDQAAFARATQEVLQALGFDMPDGDQEDEQTQSEDEEDEQEAEEQPDSSGEDDAQQEEEPEASSSTEEDQDQDADAQITQDDTQQRENDADDVEPDESQDYIPPVSEADPNYQVHARI